MAEASEEVAGARRKLQQRLGVAQLPRCFKARARAAGGGEEVDEYEAALREELSLRQIVPGVRIVAPGDPRSADSADLAAARQFLGLDINDAGEVVPIEKGTVVPRNTEGDVGEEGKEEGMSTGSKAVLLAVAVLQLGLLYLLSFDPMAATTDAAVFQ